MSVWARFGARPFIALALTASCAGSPQEAAAPASRPPEPLHRGPLTDYVSAAGVRWLVAGRPKEIAGNSWLAPALTRLLSQKRLDAYARSTGIDLRTTPSALIAGFDYGTLYMAQIHAGESAVRQNFERRLVTRPKTQSPHPELEIISGVIGQTPEALLVIRRQLIAVAVGDPTPVKIASAYAQRKLKRSPPVLAGSSLSTLPEELEAAPLRFYAPGPFTDSEWSRGAHGLLSAALAVGVALEPREPNTIRVTIVVAGDFNADAAEAAKRGESAWLEFASSSPGHLLGLDSPSSAPEVQVSEHGVELRVALRVEPIISGLRAVVHADVWEILDISKPAQSPPRVVQ